MGHIQKPVCTIFLSLQNYYKYKYKLLEQEWSLSWETCLFFILLPGCTKDWCLMCELEQQIMILRENGGPLSPSRILWHMRSINSQMGDGSQEDAHEFLRYFG